MGGWRQRCGPLEGRVRRLLCVFVYQRRGARRAVREYERQRRVLQQLLLVVVQVCVGDVRCASVARTRLRLRLRRDDDGRRPRRAARGTPLACAAAATDRTTRSRSMQRALSTDRWLTGVAAMQHTSCACAPAAADAADPRSSRPIRMARRRSKGATVWMRRGVCVIAHSYVRVPTDAADARSVCVVAAQSASAVRLSALRVGAVVQCAGWPMRAECRRGCQRATTPPADQENNNGGHHEHFNHKQVRTTCLTAMRVIGKGPSYPMFEE